MQSSKRWRALRARFITWSFVPAVLILAIVAVIALAAYGRAVQDEVISRERERAYLSVQRLKDEMSKFSDVLVSLARTEAIYQDQPSAQRTALRDARRRLSVFDGGVVLLDNFGQVVSAQPERPDISGRDWSDRPYFLQLLSGENVVFSNARKDGPAGTPVVIVAVPITNVEGEFLGALVGMFRLGEPTISALYASLVRLRVGDSSYLVDGNGQVIYHSDSDRIGTNLLSHRAVQEVLAEEIGAYRAYIDGEGDLLVAYAPVPGTPWGLITEEDWSSLTTPSRKYGQFLLLLLGFGIVLPTAWFGLLARERRAEAEIGRAHV